MQHFDPHEIQWTPEKSERLWNYISKRNPDYYSDLFGKDILKRIIKKIGTFENKTILDFGCGHAFFIDHLVSLKQKPKEYIGLDFSQDSIDFLNTKKQTGTFEHSGVFVKSLPSQLEDCSVDICFLIEVIEHLDDSQLINTLAEVYRTLKPSGYLVITTPNSENLDLMKTMCPECGCIYHKYQHVRVLNENSLRMVMYQSGYQKSIVTSATFKPKNIKLKGYIKYYYNQIFNKNNKKLFGLFQK